MSTGGVYSSQTGFTKRYAEWLAGGGGGPGGGAAPAGGGAGGGARRKKWYARRIENGTHAMGAVAALLLASARKRNAASYYRTFADIVAGFEEETGVEVPIGLSPALAAWVWEKNARDLGESPAVLSDGGIEADDAEKWLAWTAAFERDGYESDEADDAMKEACLQAVKDEEE